LCEVNRYSNKYSWIEKTVPFITGNGLRFQLILPLVRFLFLVPVHILQRQGDLSVPSPLMIIERLGNHYMGIVQSGRWIFGWPCDSPNHSLTMNHHASRESSHWPAQWGYWPGSWCNNRSDTSRSPTQGHSPPCRIVHMRSDQTGSIRPVSLKKRYQGVYYRGYCIYWRPRCCPRASTW
jgi:hypothetical protein